MANYTNEDQMCTMVDSGPAKTVSFYYPKESYIGKANTTIYGISCGPQYNHQPVTKVAKVVKLFNSVIDVCLIESGVGWEHQAIKFSLVLYQQKLINCIYSRMIKSNDRQVY